VGINKQLKDLKSLTGRKLKIGDSCGGILRKNINKFLQNSNQDK